MLSRLLVKNYVLIDSLEIDFPKGLVIITGQTGAGKSIILGSIGLVLGARADAGSIGRGEDNCVVEAEFDMPGDNAPLRALCEENDVDWDGGHLILRRVVNHAGRSRAFVNDSPVTVSLLSSLAAYLVDIHSQHQTLLLSDRNFQMSVLDYFAGNRTLLDSCAAAWKEYGALKSELSDLEQKILKIEAERDYNQARYGQLESAALRDGELGELEIEQKQLANAGEIKEHLMSVLAMLEGSDEVLSMDAALRDAEKRIAKVADYVPSLAGLPERILSCRLEMDDILAEIDAANSRTDVSEERLQQTDDRIAAIYDLFRKFGCRTEAELIAIREELSSMLLDSSELEARREELDRAVKEKYSELERIASELHESRAEAAPELASSIQDSIRFLELQDAVFGTELIPAPLSASGMDSILFTFSSTGRNPVDVAKCASGGEMSRIMLCLKAMMAQFANMPTMIFDEIDTGVSGSVADKMGSMICGMGEKMQVFAITHLPQVAAKGTAHYLVSKDSSDGEVVTGIRQLDGEERVMEIARMLSGSVLTEAAIANAKSLLGN